MADCKISSGLDCASCNDIRGKGGNEKDFYIFNFEDLDPDTPFTYNDDFSVRSINLQAYAYGYLWCAKKQSVGVLYELQVAEGSGAKFYNITIIGRFQNTTQADRVIIDSLLGGNFVIVTKNNQGQYEVHGRNAGLELTGGVKNSGVAPGDDSSYNFTFTGQADQQADVFFNTDSATTRETLQGYLE